MEVFSALCELDVLQVWSETPEVDLLVRACGLHRLQIAPLEIAKVIVRRWWLLLRARWDRDMVMFQLHEYGFSAAEIRKVIR